MIVVDVRVTGGPFRFGARFERAAAPLTCRRFESMLPYRERLIHVRWSGEACWIPLGGLELGLGYENATSYPVPVSCFSTPAALARPRSCSPMATFALAVRLDNWLAITS